MLAEIKVCPLTYPCGTQTMKATVRSDGRSSSNDSKSNFPNNLKIIAAGELQDEYGRGDPHSDNRSEERGCWRRKPPKAGVAPVLPATRFTAAKGW